MSLSKKADAALANLAMMGSWGVYADDIVACAELIKAGYAHADDDYNGPRMYLTDKGRSAAKRRGHAGAFV